MRPITMTAAVVAGLICTNVQADHDAEPKHYTPSEIIVIRARPVGGSLEVVFRSRPDTWFWCPGITTEEVDEGIAVTFVRTPVREDGVVEIKAERGKNFKQTVKFPMKGKDVFIKDGKNLKPLFKQTKDDSKKSTKGKKVKKRN